MTVSRTLGEVAEFLGLTTTTPDVQIRHLGIDSRTLGPQALWVARQGQHTHGAAHDAPQAVAVVTDSLGASLLADRGIPLLIVDDPASIVGALSSWFYDDPAQALTMWGVTGTNGKTTVTHILEHALKQLGQTPALIGTLGARAGSQQFTLARTTPEAPEVHELLSVMRSQRITDVAMEVSSHALALGRVDGIRYDMSIFTNLSQDHLDFHGSMQAYFQAKASLFTQARSKKAVINVDDEWGIKLTKQCKVPFITYGTAENADIRVRTNAVPTGMQVAISYRGQTFSEAAAMMGSFNATNIAGAFAALVFHGYEPASAFDAVIGAPSVPGRMEVIHRAPLVIVDYAHTPDAVGIVLSALRAPGGRLVAVLGCGGDRDSLKRPLMGRIAADLCDELIVTDDNPRSEDPQVIRTAVLSGAQGGTAALHEIGDRRAAISAAVNSLKDTDIVVILGKGAEQGQESMGTITPFDDRDVAREAIAERMSR